MYWLRVCRPENLVHMIVNLVPSLADRGRWWVFISSYFYEHFVLELANIIDESCCICCLLAYITLKCHYSCQECIIVQESRMWQKLLKREPNSENPKNWLAELPYDGVLCYELKQAARYYSDQELRQTKPRNMMPPSSHTTAFQQLKSKPKSIGRVVKRQRSQTEYLTWIRRTE